MALGSKGSLEGIWISMRAVDAESGERMWLQEHSEASKEPRFTRMYNDHNLIFFSCEGLDPHRIWQLTFGLHLPHTVEFFVDRPAWDRRAR